jgi:hypothetical protein
MLSAVLSGCAAAPCAEPAQEWARDAERVFAAFQGFVRCRQYSKAHLLLSKGAKESMPYEEFFLGLTAFEAPRRLIGSLEVHAVDAAAGRVRLCSPEFGAGRDFRLAKLGPIYVLDFDASDVDYLKGRAMEWYRGQVRRADGWHFAYPPDWDYAPLSRACICGKR